MVLRYRVCIGAKRPEVLSIEDDATFAQLKERIAEMVGLCDGDASETPAVDLTRVHIHFGFPPQEVKDIQDGTQLAETDLARGGNLKVKVDGMESAKAPGLAPADTAPASSSSTTAAPPPSSASAPSSSSPSGSQAAGTAATLASSSQRQQASKPHPLRVSVPADNSCLFRSLIFLLDCPPGGLSAISDDSIMTMRLMVASLVQSDPERFTAAILGKPVDEYLAWITDSSHWGGYIELTAIARAFGVSIRAIDIQTLRVDEYQGGDDTQCCYVLYDGIHYDPLVISHSGDGSEVGMAKTFPTADDDTRAAMLSFAKELHDLRQFTNVQDFALMCLDCQKGLRGQAEAREHSKLTGHINFCETEG